MRRLIPLANKAIARRRLTKLSLKTGNGDQQGSFIVIIQQHCAIECSLYSHFAT